MLFSLCEILSLFLCLNLSPSVLLFCLNEQLVCLHFLLSFPVESHSLYNFLYTSFSHTHTHTNDTAWYRKSRKYNHSIYWADELGDITQSMSLTNHKLWLQSYLISTYAKREHLSVSMWGRIKGSTLQPGCAWTTSWLWGPGWLATWQDPSPWWPSGAACTWCGCRCFTSPTPSLS